MWERWMLQKVQVVLCGVIFLFCPLEAGHAAQPTDPEEPDRFSEPVDWDILPNGWIEVRFGRTDGGVPDSVAWHQERSTEI